MLLRIVTLLALSLMNLSAQTSRPSSRPSNPDADDTQARRLPAEWGDEAPGRAVMNDKLLPITKAPYSKPGEMKHPISDADLVVGIARGGVARAYPINMLGGPSREIINDVVDGTPYAVNW